MAPEHYIRLEVDTNADNHWDGGQGNGFEVLMVVMNEEGSCNQVRFSCFGTAVAFLFDSRPASSRVRELSTTIYVRTLDY